MFSQIFCLVLGLMAVYFYWIKRTRKLKGIVLDGPKGVPILGCALDINDRNIPFKLMEYATQFGKIFRLKMLNENVVVLNSEEIIRKALGGEDYKQCFNDRQDMFYAQHFRGSRKSTVVIRDGASAYYKTVKKGFMNAVHTYGSGLQDLENNVMTEMEYLLKRMHGMHGKEFECVEMFQRSLSNVISLLLTGETIADDDPDLTLFWEYVHNADFFFNPQVNLVMTALPVLRFFPGRHRTKYLDTKNAVARIGQRYFDDVKKTYVAGEVRGVVDHYLEVQRKETISSNEIVFTDDQIKAEILDVIHGGITTTLTHLSNSTLILLNHPQYQTKLQEEIDRVIGRNRMPTFTDRENCPFYRAFELEVMRYITPVPLLLPHVCSDHVELEGFDIEKNSTVLVNVFFVHHNKDVWGDPWVFRPERFLDEQGNLLPKEHKLIRNVIPFGYGPRRCPGDNFSRTRIFLYITCLFQRMSFEFPEGQFKSCDPRDSENFEIKEIFRALPFLCRFRERF